MHLRLDGLVCIKHACHTHVPYGLVCIQHECRTIRPSLHKTHLSHPKRKTHQHDIYKIYYFIIAKTHHRAGEHQCKMFQSGFVSVRASLA